MNDVDSVRHAKINDLCSGELVASTKNVDMGCLPRCRRSLLQHIQRVNYQVGIWKRSLTPNPHIPEAEGHGWVKIDSKLEPLWYEGSMLPSQLTDVSAEQMDTDDDSDNDSDIEIEDVFSANQSE